MTISTRSPKALVTIGMPVYNAASYVEQAVASIVAQHFGAWRLLVIDDGSTDDTIERASSIADPRVEIVTGGENRGLPHRLNQAVAMADTPFFARMDGDDVAYPGRLARQMEYLEAHPECDVVATHMLVIDEDGEAKGVERWRGGTHEAITARPWNGFHFNHATWVGRTAWFRRFPYRESAVRTEDDDLLLRAYRESVFARLEEVLYAYRVGPLRLSQILRARRSFCRSLIREAAAQGDWRLLRGVAGQSARALVDALSIGSGAERWMLRHRAEPASADLVAAWAEASREIQSGLG